MSGFIIGVYQCICYMEGIVEQLFHKQTADGFAGSYHMIDQSSENRKLDKILKELVVFTRCLLQELKLGGLTSMILRKWSELLR